MGDEWTFPNEDQAKNDQRHVDHRVAEQEDVEHAARVVAEGPEEICEGGMLLLQTLNLMAFQREERRLQAGKKRRAVDQETIAVRRSVSPTAVIPYPRLSAQQPSIGKRIDCVLGCRSSLPKRKLSSP